MAFHQDLRQVNFLKMKQRTVRRIWLSLFIIACSAVLILIYLAYLFKIPLPKFTWLDIGFMFMFGFFPSVIGKVYGNLKEGQIRRLNVDGLVSSFRESVYNWIIYYTGLAIIMVIYNYAAFRELPALW